MFSSSSGSRATDQLVSSVANPLNSNDTEMQESSPTQTQALAQQPSHSHPPSQPDIIVDVEQQPSIQISTPMSGSSIADGERDGAELTIPHSKHIAFESDNDIESGQDEVDDDIAANNTGPDDYQYLTTEDDGNGGDVIDVSEDDDQYSHDENVSIYSTMNQIESIPGTETDLKSEAASGGAGEATNADDGQRNIHKSSIIDIDSDSDIDNLEEFEQTTNNPTDEVSRELEMKGLYKDDDEQQSLTREPEHEEYFSEDIPNSNSNNNHLEEDETVNNAADGDEGEDEIRFEDANIPVILKVADTEFLLYPIDQDKCEVDCSLFVSLYDNSDIIHVTIEEFFGIIRSNEDLKEFSDFKVNEELILQVPQLSNLKVTEDNVYSKDISIEDFFRVFLQLKENTGDSETIPNHISINLTTQPRFISEFNGLSELIREGKGFESLLKLNPTKRQLVDGEEYDIEKNAKKQKLQD